MSRSLLVLFCLSLAADGQPPRVAVIAHRGEHLHHAENTLPAYEAAIAAGADFFEADVRTTADGRLVLMHDAKVDRTTNGKGEVASLTFADLRKLEAGPNGERIPEFDEALALAHGRIGVYVDSKTVSAADMLAALKRHAMEEHVVVYGGASYLKDVRALNPKIRLMPEARDAPTLRALIPALGLRVAAFDAGDFLDPVIAVAREAGVEIYVDRLGASDNPASWQDAVDRGAAGIQTDHPAELVQYLKGRRYR